MHYAGPTRLNFSRANPSDAHLADAQIESADLSNALLCRADLTRAIPAYAILDGAELEQANLADAALENAEVEAGLSGGSPHGPKWAMPWEQARPAPSTHRPQWVTNSPPSGMRHYSSSGRCRAAHPAATSAYQSVRG
ncbi:pentapeptide repeat-containing protein [Streptomyces sp. NPDC047043]|uniref:pentapeptide repeat-containing protein n=1 Tax=Streptomyces sp. NPDC047043 TaxID=3154497 RepID=UPI0033E947EE